MKLVSFVAIKGGVGKTTLALLTGQYLAQKVTRCFLSTLTINATSHIFMMSIKTLKRFPTFLLAQVMSPFYPLPQKLI